MSAAALLASRPRRKFSPQEYLAIERVSECKSEYYEGEIFAMAGASLTHDLIAGNTLANLHRQLRQQGCRAHTSDMRVGITHFGPFFYPDVSAVCGEPKLLDRHKDTLLNPSLIVEVLSKSTQAYDRGFKLKQYQLIASVKEILFIFQERIRVEHYAKRRGKGWIERTYSSRDDVVELGSLKSTLALADIYDGVSPH